MEKPSFLVSSRRIGVYYAFLTFILIVIAGRLFFIQVIRHDYYESEALSGQLKQFEIPAERGAIYAYDGQEIVPLVLNETRYRVVADPDLIKDAQGTANQLSGIINRSSDDIRKQLENNSRYEILANKQTKEVKEKIENLKLAGIFTNEKVPLRVYIQGPIASQVLGFVNDDGVGTYGIEQYYNDQLSGKSGRVKALTDKNNVPLLATSDNILTDPEDGKDIVLTLDISMQKQVEAILKQGLENAKSDSGSLLVMDAKNGYVRAIANYPSYDASKFNEVEDASLFTNPAVSDPLEPGSVVKVLTAAAALDVGAVNKDQSYYDPSRYSVDGYTITNIEEDGGPQTRTVSDILRFSLNTGATWLLMQMGGGELNEQGRQVWHDYLVNHYGFGSKTGIEQGYESEGFVPDPDDGYGLNIQYANTAFGQGMMVTPLQLAAAVTSVVNGGDYYQPSLYAGVMDNNGSLSAEDILPTKTDVVKEDTSQIIREFMNNVVSKNNRPAVREGYQVGGKTGTAEIANPAGGYYDDVFNGTYVGYVGGGTPDYVIVVRVNKPKIGGYAGAKAAAPIFASVSNMLIDNFTVSRISD